MADVRLMDSFLQNILTATVNSSLRPTRMVIPNTSIKAKPWKIRVMDNTPVTAQDYMLYC